MNSADQQETPSHWRGRPLLALCLAMAFLQLLALYPTFCVALGSIPDEGVVALQAMNVMLGKVPHRDYFILTPISSDYWVAAWFCIFGNSLESLRAYFFTEMALSVACLQWVSARIFPKGWSELPPLFFLCTGPYGWMIASPRWDAMFFLLLALVCLDWPMLSGVMVGLAALTQHPAGAAGCAGISLALALKTPGGLATKYKAVRTFWLGILLLWFPFLLYLTSQDLVTAFFSDTIYFTLNTYAAAHKVGFDWNGMVSGLWAGLHTLRAGDVYTGFILLAYAIVDISTYGTWFALALLAPVWGLRSGKLPAAMGLSLTFLTLLEYVRPNRYHFGFHRPFVLLALVALVRLAARGRRGLAVVLLICHALVAVAFIRSNLGSDIPVALPKGTLYVRDPERSEAMRSIAEVNASIAPGEKIFFFPDEPLLQWLLGRGPATRDVAAFPQYYPFAHFVQTRLDLKNEGVENLCYVPMTMDFSAYPGLSPEAHAREEKWLVGFLSEGYRVSRRVAGLTFFRRKDLP
ncbi:MAG: hypothetical protein U0931_23360 [Vulcanimicrobiota bacterium]